MWNIDFISEDNFRKHVKETIEKYGEKLKPVDLKQFNKNIVDPVKMFMAALGKKLLEMKFSGKEINLIIMLLVIFIKEFFNI